MKCPNCKKVISLVRKWGDRDPVNFCPWCGGLVGWEFHEVD